MLPKLDSYEAIRRQFRWEIPAFYNIGVDLCDKWASDISRLALIHERRDGTVIRQTFDDLKRLSNRTANLLVARDVKPGDRVGILLPQEPETALAHLATYKLGAIAVPLFTLFGLDALRYRLADAGIKALVTNGKLVTAWPSDGVSSRCFLAHAARRSGLPNDGA